MIIAIPVDDNKDDICISFGRTPYFLFKDTETGAIEICENPAAEAEGGAGVKAGQFMLDNKVDIIITIRCGENVLEVFESAKIKFYKSKAKGALENITLYEKGELDILDHFHKGFHGNV